MLIYVKIKKKKCFSSDGRTDTRTTQNYSSEPHKKKFLFIQKFKFLTLTLTFMHMCMITLSANIFLDKGQKFLHFFLQKNYKTVY